MFTMDERNFLQGTNRIPKAPGKVLMLSHKGARAEEGDAQQVEGGEVGTGDAVDGPDLFAIGTVSHIPLRLRGGGMEGSSDEESTEEPLEK